MRAEAPGNCQSGFFTKAAVDELVELIMAFEEQFGGEISDEEAQKITTVGEAVAFLAAHGAAA